MKHNIIYIDEKVIEDFFKNENIKSEDKDKWLFVYKLVYDYQYAKLCSNSIKGERLINFQSWIFRQYNNKVISSKLKTLCLTALSKINSNFDNDIKAMAIESMSKTIDENKREGIVCPVCNKTAKEYKRSISTNMCRFLVNLVNQYKVKNTWIHHSNIDYNARDYPWLAWWGLAETQKDTSLEKKTTGMWRPTLKGIEFVLGETTVSKYVYTYNGAPSAFSKEKISFKEASKNKFSFKKLINR